MNDDLETLYEDIMEALHDDDMEEAQELLNRMIELAPDNPLTLEMQGDVALWGEEPQQAKQHYQLLLKTAPNDYWKGVAHTSLGSLYVSLGQMKEVRSHFVAAYECYVAADTIEKAAEASGAIASFDVERGEFESAAEVLRAGLALATDSGDPDEIHEYQPHLLLMLGTCYRQQGKLTEAQDTLKQALKLFQMFEVPDEAANVLDALGVIQQIQGHYDAAEELHLKAVEINETIGSLEGQSTNYGNLTILNIHRKQWDQAANWAGKAYLIDKDHDDENGVAHYHLLMGEIEAERGNFDKAEDHLRQSEELYQEHGDAEDIICLQGKKAVLYRLQGKYDEASEINERNLKEAERMGHGDGIAAILEDLGSIRKAQGKTQEAKEYWQRALDAYEELGAEQMIKDVRQQLEEL